MNWLRSWLGGSCRDRLKPLVGLRQESPAHWVAECDRPQFLVASGQRWPAGWYDLTLCLSGEVAGVDSAFCFDHGQGFCEPDRLVLTLRAPGTPVKRIIHLPWACQALRWDAVDRAGAFRIDALAIRRVPAWYARQRLWKKVLAVHPDWRGSDPAAARRRLAEQAAVAKVDETELLVSLYASTYGHRPASASVGDQAYHRWIRDWEGADRPPTATPADLAAGPRFSVVMPVYNTDPLLLRRAIASVQAQSWGNWELCIADDASPRPEIAPLLRSASADPRIRVVFREANGHISAASNSALGLATGDWAVLLDHDDELHPHALAWLAATIRAHPAAGLVFSDADKIDLAGIRHAPCFKGDFNPELLQGQNQVSHLGCYRLDLVRQAGGFRTGLEGSQDWDLALRISALCGVANVIHIPRILYHWRMVEGSTALGIAAKPYAPQAARRAVRDHFASQGVPVQVVPAPGCHHFNRVIFALPSPPPRISAIVPTRDRLDLLQRCIEGIHATATWPLHETLIIDNGSTDPATLAWLAQAAGRFAGLRVIRDPAPFNYAALNNRAAAEATGDLLLFLNNDVEPMDREWQAELASRAMLPGIGPVGAALWYPDGTLQHGGIITGLGGDRVAGHLHHRLPFGHQGYVARAVLAARCTAVTAACLMLRRAAFQAVHGFDEAFAVAFNDVDLCLRLADAGLASVWTPWARMWHHESATRGTGPDPARRQRMQEEVALLRARWGERLDRDPHLSPHLSLAQARPAIESRPRLRPGQLA